MKPELKFEAPRPQESPASMRFLSESFQPQNGSNGCERVTESYVFGGFCFGFKPSALSPVLWAGVKWQYKAVCSLTAQH